LKILDNLKILENLKFLKFRKYMKNLKRFNQICVEGPISIQFIGEHPDGGNRPYRVAKSTYPPPEKPRDAVSASGQRFHFI